MSKELTEKVVSELVNIVEGEVKELGETGRKNLGELFTEVINKNFWRTYDT